MMFLLASLAFSLAGAADKPVCSAKSISRDCAFFKEHEDQARITLSDGTYYDNPLYDGSKQNKKVPQSASASPYGGMGSGTSGGMGMGTGAYGGANNQNYQAMADKALRNQSEILDLLENSGYSTDFKLAYSQSAAFQAAFPDVPMSLPWPPTLKGAARKTVTAKELDTFFKQTIGERKYVELKKIVDAQKAPLEQQYLAQKKAEQESLERQQKQKEALALEAENKNRRVKRLQELFDYAKDQEVQILTRGKPESQWSDIEKSLAAKIRSLKLGDMALTAYSPTCVGSPENAFYKTNGTVNLCPGNLFKPEPDVLRTIAHEIGHSVDPCHFQMPQWTVDRVKFDKFKEGLTESQRADAMALIADGNSMDIDPKFIANDEKLVDDMIAQGVLVKTREKLSFDKYPFKKEYSCLVQQTGFRENSQKDLAQTSSFLRKAAAMTDDPKRSGKTVDRYEKAMKEYPQCVKSVAHASQMGEVAGDMMGVLVQEKFISEHPFKNEEEKVGSSQFIRRSCGKDQDPESLSPNLVSNILLTILTDEHPQNSQRIDHIAVSLPGLADAYGCKRSAPGCFDHLSLTTRRGSGSSNGDSSSTKSEGGRK
jgi:hypothetical protein